MPPTDGALLDQDEGLLNYMETCYRAYTLAQQRLKSLSKDDMKFIVWMKGGPGD